MAEPVHISADGHDPAFTPRLVALDIDGTILVPEPENGFSVEETTPAVRDAIDRALEAGCHVVLASGRAPLSMSVVLRHLDMPRDKATKVLAVASNGAAALKMLARHATEGGVVRGRGASSVRTSSYCQNSSGAT